MRDKEVEKLIKLEEKRQKKAINLIASENFVSKDVLSALGSVFVNKYAEGYAGKRYYGGNEIVDKLETLCQKRALKLFKLGLLNSTRGKWHVNVQSYSGSPANLAVYAALVPKGGKIMGMSLEMGGHLTHGQKVSITGKFWEQVAYGVDKKTEQLDYEEILRIAKKEKPALIVAGATAYSRKIDFKKFRKIADAVGAYLMVDMSHIAGLVAGGGKDPSLCLHPSPFKHADIVTTTTHKTLRGPRAALIFSRRSSLGGSAAKWRPSRLDVPNLIDRAVFPGLQGGPHMNQVAAVAVALKEATRPAFKKYARQVVKNAKILANELKKRGWRIISGGTDTHLFLMDVWQRNISGREASEKLGKAGIIVNKNTIPFDTRKPADPSGIRIGTAAVTTMGMKEKDMIKIAGKIDKILKGKVKE